MQICPVGAGSYMWTDGHNEANFENAPKNGSNS